MTGHDTSDSYRDRGFTAAMILNSFGLFEGGRPSAVAERYESIRQLSVEWQKTGAGAIWGEGHAHLLGIEPNRVHELIGSIAAAGEQLGLAWTAHQDMQRWLAFEHDGRPMAARAFAEMCAYFALGAAQTVGNATLRTLLLNSAIRPILQRLGKTEYTPFSNHPSDWHFFNGKLIEHLKVGAATIDNADVDELISIVDHLQQDALWKRLVARRGLDYHRWRPQSIGYGVPRSSFWEPLADRDGRRLPRRSTRGFHANPDADYRTVAEIATEGLLALEKMMYTWLNHWPLAMAGVGAKMFKTPEGQ